jgi:hypothetical protein
MKRLIILLCICATAKGLIIPLYDPYAAHIPDDINIGTSNGQIIVWDDGNSVWIPTTNFTWHDSNLSLAGTIISTGTTGDTPVSDAGTRFMYIPSKRALRIGEVTGTKWNDNYIGTDTLVFGDSMARGDNNYIFGDDSNCHSGSSDNLTQGYGNECSEVFNFLAGNQLSSDQAYSFGHGYKIIFSHDYAAAFGWGYTTLAEDDSFNLGWGQLAYSFQLADANFYRATLRLYDISLETPHYLSLGFNYNKAFIYSSNNEIDFNEANLSTGGKIEWYDGNSTKANAAYAHIDSNGTDHTFINQDVRTTSSPSFNALTLTGDTSVISSAHEIELQPNGVNSNFFQLQTANIGGAYYPIMKAMGTNATVIFAGAIKGYSFFHLVDGTLDLSKSIWLGNFMGSGGWLGTTGIDLIFYTGNTNHVHFTNSTYYAFDDKVRIGDTTTTPTAMLEVEGNIRQATLTQTAVGPTDNLDIGNDNIVFVDTSSNNVTIGGFINGVAGQVLQIVVVNATNNTVLEHNEGTGNQDIFLDSGGDETLTASYGGWTLVCNGTHWYEVDN